MDDAQKAALSQQDANGQPLTSTEKETQDYNNYLDYMRSYAKPSVAKPTIDVATNQAIENGANPLSLALAKKQLGSNAYIGYCESFVESVQGGGWKGTSATDAWNNQIDKAVGGLQGVQPGDAIYFKSDNPDGHTGIYAGDNQFISATDNGVKQEDIDQWTKSTGQEVLGYVPNNGQ